MRVGVALLAPQLRHRKGKDMPAAPTPVDRPDGGTIALLLAGGRGTRLHELTRQDCKPALHFAGARRIVDFAMANVVRSGLDRLVVATQWQPRALVRHLRDHWAMGFDCGAGLVISDGHAVAGREGYRGTADAVTRNIPGIDAAAPREVIVLAADHVYEMDYREMIAAHRAAGRAVTVAAHTVPRASATEFGVIAADTEGRVLDFVEKPDDPPSVAGDPVHALASMGIYVFDWAWLRAALLADAGNTLSQHDFGHDILPLAVARGEVGVWRLPGLRGARPYWRDVGTLDAFRVTQLDFLQPAPPCALPETAMPDGGALLARLAGGKVQTAGKIQAGAVVSDSVLLPGATVAAGARLTRAIVAPDTHVPGGLVIGEDAAEDRRWFRRTGGCTVLVTAEMLAAREAAEPRFRAFAS